VSDGDPIALLTMQRIGSIRRVDFHTGKGRHDRAATAPLTALEIETKSGRYVHLRNDTESNRLRLVPGPAAPPADTAASTMPAREWRDLTAALPAAFDGRPAISRVEATGADATRKAQWLADAWLLHLSTGAQLSFRPGPTGPECVAIAPREASWTR